MHVEFTVDIAGVGLDCVDRDEKPGADLLIRESVGDELEHLKFTFAERFDQLRLGELSFWGDGWLRLHDGECRQQTASVVRSDTASGGLVQ